ncbi:MAG: acetyl-CoA carboxylase biotin carboxylase subunit [Elusimicrobia bacterium]|nr:acetyl-CoA carboxylase biotin carboxylase subunit [Elusimicrobiota bacterium]MBU2614554.1 acetyl-CoA carboxylase biotin carboxylase subunit [Elusimicrobiota bacterium]
MFKKVLIANRGEIAVRVIRACRELGILTVAVNSEVDKDSMHVKLADQSICIGPGPAIESYLNIPNIISAATISGCDAIHPGYGFLSENTYFADVCESCGLKFIGPSKESIQKMGDKIEARKIMIKNGINVVPGTTEPISLDDPGLDKIAEKIGYPLIIKAAMGGGGRGMRTVPSKESLQTAISTAKTEAKAAFGDDKVYLEKLIEQPRHIEFQIAADNKGNTCYFPERDCSIQRRHQKLVEESPSPFVDKDLRKKMGKQAVKAAKAVKYCTVGTIEFLVDKKSNFYFLEMNTRIQVEHPITEIVSGVDLVKLQIKLAAGEELKLDSDKIKVCGHAIECRINAEDPDKDFMPSPGRVSGLILPGGPGVRLDTHIYEGYLIPSFYDSLIAKLITYGYNRKEAISRMERALTEFKVTGIKTTAPLHKKIMKNDYFRKGDFQTDFILKHIYGNL